VLYAITQDTVALRHSFKVHESTIWMLEKFL